MIKKWMKLSGAEAEEIGILKTQPCYAKDCTLPIIGGRTTDDGLRVNFCEFHFAENFLSMVDKEDEEEATFELAKILAWVQVGSQDNQQGQMLN